MSRIPILVLWAVAIAIRDGLLPPRQRKLLTSLADVIRPGTSSVQRQLDALSE